MTIKNIDSNNNKNNNSTLADLIGFGFQVIFLLSTPYWTEESPGYLLPIACQPIASFLLTQTQPKKLLNNCVQNECILQTRHKLRMQHLNLPNIRPSSYVYFVCVCAPSHVHLLEKMSSLANTSTVVGDDKPVEAALLVTLCVLILLTIFLVAVIIIFFLVCIYGACMWLF